MANYILFISENRLKDSTAIGNSVDVEYILPYIKVAQKKYIETKLGTDLFAKLQSDISGSSLTGAYQTLVRLYFRRFGSLEFLRSTTVFKIQSNE